MLQAGQNDPRSRGRCQLLMGQAFTAKGDPAQAVEILQEAMEKHDRGMDDVGKAIMYHLGLALEADGRDTEARAVLSKLLRVDYNYAGGDARQRVERIKSKT
jgi:tetratricopeptide (TPR) repeat protein